MEIHIESKTIITNRLILRPFKKGDFYDVHQYSTDLEVCRFMPWGPNSYKDTKNFLSRAIKNRKKSDNGFCGEHAVILKQNKELLGGCGLYIESKRDKEYMIGYCLKKSAWGKGYATELSKALCYIAFKHLDAHRVIATCDTENYHSYHVMEKLGMKREGCFREKCMIQEQWRDEYLYAILKDDWIVNQLY